MNASETLSTEMMLFLSNKTRRKLYHGRTALSIKDCKGFVGIDLKEPLSIKVSGFVFIQATHPIRIELTVGNGTINFTTDQILHTYASFDALVVSPLLEYSEQTKVTIYYT